MSAIPKMSPAILIAYDGSGSTGGNFFYHKRTQEIVSQYPQAESQILLWDTSYRRISRSELQEINSARKGYGGTCSSMIAGYVKITDFHGHLVIITDGLVSPYSIDECTRLLGPNWHFESVTAHLINTGGVVNMSVTCPFTRVSPHQIYCYNSHDGYKQQLTTSMTTEDLVALETLHTIATVADYEARADVIERLVISRTMGTTGDPSLRDAILAMKKRIIAAEAAAFGASDTVTAFKAALACGATLDAVKAARRIHTEYYTGDERTWSARISRLISMCEGALRSAFDLNAVNDAILSDRIRRAAAIASTPVPAETTAETAGSTENPFICPITMDEARDVILLVAEGTPILEGLDKAIVNDIFDCPLNLFRYPEVVTALRERLDHPFSLTGYREALAAGSPITMSPLTRRPLLAGGLCIGNTEEHCEATRWTLAQLTTGRTSKLVGNADLWFLCIWLLIARAPADSYLKTIEPLIADHCRWRLHKHTTFIALTGLPEFPTTRVPLAVAIWYVLVSPLWTGAVPKRDLIRTHLPHLRELEQIHRELTPEFALPLPHILTAHTQRVRVMLSMLAAVKREGGYTQLREILAGLTQGTVDPRRVWTDKPISETVAEREHLPALVPIDGLPSLLQQSYARKLLSKIFPVYDLDDDTLVALGDLVDPNKSAGDIPLPYHWMPPDHATLPGRVEWAYGTGPQPEKLVQICPATCRPVYVTDPESGETWVDEARRLHGIEPSKMISLNKQFGNFVCKYGAYPTRAEFLVFLYNRYVRHGSHGTLPHAIVEFINQVFIEFRDVMRDLSPTEFTRRFMGSVALPTRQALERLLT